MNINFLKTYPTIFVNNKYLIWYEQLINTALLRKLDDTISINKHHYIPKSIIPNNNIVALTEREHYIAHLLLAKCVTAPYQKKMIYAITAMKFKIIPRITVNSKVYASMQKLANINRSILHTGKIVSEHTKQKLREANLGKKASAETKAKLRESAKHKPARSKESIEKTRLAHLGSKRSEETKELMRKICALRIPLLCSHCLKFVSASNYSRWHGRKCKLNASLSKILPHIGIRPLNNAGTSVNINGVSYISFTQAETLLNLPRNLISQLLKTNSISEKYNILSIH